MMFSCVAPNVHVTVRLPWPKPPWEIEALCSTHELIILRSENGNASTNDVWRKLRDNFLREVWRSSTVVTWQWQYWADGNKSVATVDLRRCALCGHRYTADVILRPMCCAELVLSFATIVCRASKHTFQRGKLLCSMHSWKALLLCSQYIVAVLFTVYFSWIQHLVRTLRRIRCLPPSKGILKLAL